MITSSEATIITLNHHLTWLFPLHHPLWSTCCKIRSKASGSSDLAFGWLNVGLEGPGAWSGYPGIACFNWPSFQCLPIYCLFKGWVGGRRRPQLELSPHSCSLSPPDRSFVMNDKVSLLWVFFSIIFPAWFLFPTLFSRTLTDFSWINQEVTTLFF